MRAATKVEEEEHRWAEVQLLDPEVACIVMSDPGVLEHNPRVFSFRVGSSNTSSSAAPP
jgi:hypothetical protein